MDQPTWNPRNESKRHWFHPPRPKFGTVERSLLQVEMALASKSVRDAFAVVQNYGGLPKDLYERPRTVTERSPREWLTYTVIPFGASRFFLVLSEPARDRRTKCERDLTKATQAITHHLMAKARIEAILATPTRRQPKTLIKAQQRLEGVLTRLDKARKHQQEASNTLAQIGTFEARMRKHNTFSGLSQGEVEAALTTLRGPSGVPDLSPEERWYRASIVGELLDAKKAENHDSRAALAPSTLRTMGSYQPMSETQRTMGSYQSASEIGSDVEDVREQEQDEEAEAAWEPQAPEFDQEADEQDDEEQDDDQE